MGKKNIKCETVDISPGEDGERIIIQQNAFSNHYAPMDFQQRLLLKSLTITKDPKKLRQMIGARTVADVFRTMDKIAMRKEYQQALLDNGIDFDTIVKGIKNICVNAKKDETKLRGWEIILKSLGMGDYKETPQESLSSWEEEVMKQLTSGDGNESVKIGKYEVVAPEVPEEIKRNIDLENDFGKKLYE